MKDEKEEEEDEERSNGTKHLFKIEFKFGSESEGMNERKRNEKAARMTKKKEEAEEDEAKQPESVPNKYIELSLCLRFFSCAFFHSLRTLSVRCLSCFT